MTKPETAVSLFREGFSCSQGVFAAFAGDLGLGRETALRLAQPFGGGIARRADWCGALTGAFLAIGLEHGRVRAEDAAARDKTYALVNELVRRFEARHGATACADLLGVNIGTPEGQAAAREANLFKTTCPGLVASAAAILEEIGV